MGGDTNVLWFSHGEEETVTVEEKFWGLPAPHNLKQWKLHDCASMCLRQCNGRAISEETA